MRAESSIRNDSAYLAFARAGRAVSGMFIATIRLLAWIPAADDTAESSGFL